MTKSQLTELAQRTATLVLHATAIYEAEYYILAALQEVARESEGRDIYTAALESEVKKLRVRVNILERC